MKFNRCTPRAIASNLGVGWKVLKRTAPLLLLAFIIVGYIEVLPPQDLIQPWIGPQSGLTGILIAEGGGMLLPDGPYAVFPIIVVLYDAGSWTWPDHHVGHKLATLALISVSFELPFMGWCFTAVRWGSSLLIPLLAGLAAWMLFRS